MISRPTPEAISNHKDAWFWVREWRRTHCRHQQSCGCFAGSPGAGKSYAALASAELIDRDSEGGTRFDISQVAFSAQEFFEQINAKLPIGAACLLDDAAVLAYSGDTLKKEVKEISKAFQSQRHLRRTVLLTMPSLTMLTKTCVQTLQFYIEMRGIDETLQQSTAKLLRLQLNPRLGKIYFKRFRFKKKSVHPIHGLPVSREYTRPDLTFSLPSEKLVKAYEKKRAEAMRVHYQKAEKIAAGKKKVKENTFVTNYKKVEENLENYLDNKGKISKGKLLMAGISHHHAGEIKKMIDAERKKGK